MNHKALGRGWKLMPLAALLVCAAVGACVSSTITTSPGGAGPTASAMQHPMLENIPIPAGFKLVDERSFGRSCGQLRYANCEFRGDTDPATVNRFYEQHMPSAGFTLREKSFDFGEYVLRFDSSSERSMVRAKRDKLKTVLVIDISPTPKGTAQREPKPPVRRP